MRTPIPESIRRAWDNEGTDAFAAMRQIGRERVQRERCVHLGCTKRATRTGITCGAPACISYVGVLPNDLAVQLQEEKAAMGEPWWSGTLLAVGMVAVLAAVAYAAGMQHGPLVAG